MKRLIILGVVWMSALYAYAGPLDETRYCGTPVRNEDGSIKRSYSVLSSFQNIHPCPSTGLTSGPCPGWAKNHVIPLGCGGCDAVSNLQWLPVDIKACAGSHCVDRFERKIYSFDIPGTPGCEMEVVK